MSIVVSSTASDSTTLSLFQPTSTIATASSSLSSTFPPSVTPSPEVYPFTEFARLPDISLSIESDRPSSQCSSTTDPSSFSCYILPSETTPESALNICLKSDSCSTVICGTGFFPPVAPGRSSSVIYGCKLFINTSAIILPADLSSSPTFNSSAFIRYGRPVNVNGIVTTFPSTIKTFTLPATRAATSTRPFQTGTYSGIRPDNSNVVLPIVFGLIFFFGIVFTCFCYGNVSQQIQTNRAQDRRRVADITLPSHHHHQITEPLPAYEAGHYTAPPIQHAAVVEVRDRPMTVGEAMDMNPAVIEQIARPSERQYV
ncbi:hypothetical protein BC829DRAFT_492807 [Chytridium lagenaria]|nr:hypothetical protein BC829DRAFT_492807 [Chytridium lagenaria]